MERTRSKDTPNYDSEEEILLPEIATKLDMSVSQLEQYPAEIRQALCLTYINNSSIDDTSIVSSLNKIIQLDTNTPTAQPVIEEPKTVEPKKEENYSFQMSIKNLQKSARIISQKTTEQNKQIEREQEEIRLQGANNNA